VPIFRKDGKNILFIHVPKAGGSSIETAFKAAGYSTLYLDGRVGRDSANYVRRCTPQHMHGAMLRQNFRLQRFDAIFMIVRDPIARFRSEYLWRNRDQAIDVSASAVEKWGKDSFRGFDFDSYIYDNHLRPQADFFVEGARVYRFEDGLNTAVADLNDRYGLGVEPEVPHVRTGHGSTGYSSGDVEISDVLRETIMQFYRRDYEAYGYGSVPASVRSRLVSGSAGKAFARYYRAFKSARAPRG
jgi:hypothetical protein